MTTPDAPVPRDFAAIMSDVAEIRRLLFEAYDHYFATSDGHCKSSEGYVALHFPNYFDRPAIEPRVEIYSYVLGPHRNHDFVSVVAALAAVREWHAEEMAIPAGER